jgi:hypothetical protein
MTVATVTQVGSKSASVTLHAKRGLIMTSGEALAPKTSVTFVVVNRHVFTESLVVADFGLGGQTGDTLLTIGRDVDGGFAVVLFNAADQPKAWVLAINFAVLDFE